MEIIHISLVSSLIEDDIEEGTEKVKRAILEVFYELNKQRGGGVSLLKKINSVVVPLIREKEPISLLTSMVDPNEDTVL